MSTTPPTIMRLTLWVGAVEPPAPQQKQPPEGDQKT